jgi:peptidoglycan/LPS O-acetylase OafA/YrhL
MIAPVPDRLGYRPALDGVRAVAIVMVLLVHTGAFLVPGSDDHVLPGGALGVDLFFVLSGFLITSLLVNEFEGTGRLALGSFWIRRARRLLPALFVVLAAVGIYAVVSYAVARRTTEIGVRLALGATAGRVVTQIVGESLRVIGAGALVAWVLALVIVLHLVREPIEPAIFIGVPLALLLVAAFASWLPARRATSVDVMDALREE